jgi:hypothetical protein
MMMVFASETPAMQTITRPLSHPARQTDGMRRLVSVIAEDLRRLYDRDGRMDQAGAERHLRFIVAQARKEAAKPGGVGLDSMRPSPVAGTAVSAGAPGRAAPVPGGRAQHLGRSVARQMRDPLAAVRVGLVARVRRQIAEGSYESEERLEAALCGLADELGI